jgi:putative oxidoreductase
MERANMKKLVELYLRFAKAASFLQSPFLLFVRLYWGWQFIVTGWGHMHGLPGFIQFFTKLGIPFPAANAYFVSGLEFVGGMLLILGLGTRLIGLLLAGDMMVAFLTADRDALATAFTSDPTNFYAASEYTFLFAAVIVLIFGAGYFSLDKLIVRRLGSRSAAHS